MFRLRLTRLLILWLFSKPSKFLDTHELKLIAWPLVDVDISRMMAHAFTRAFALGRYQVMFGSEFRRIAIKRKWFPMTIAEMSTLSKPVFMFERFSVTSQIVCWTDRRIYAEQKIVVRGEVRARCIVEGLPFSPRGKLTPAQMFDALALHIESPPIPVDIALWIEGRERVAANQKH
jgi:hypothetical protein